ncbi:glycoside hydrolase family 3 N-terminal domain-containing protein [Clostridium sp.]|uniref:glycoside hydrolase family 3 N-terminal domain-containing protein n=1 Tax=Clostridium sp. TaxID=1506 RepID=UPI0025C48C4D|nr:glycoside hydrolase family 3 N-terminal domain-containing protein [Clostridium sp.]
MNREELRELLNSLTIREKIAQTVQLNGNIFTEKEKTMNTGPVKDLGFKDSFDFYEIGSTYNVNDYEEVYRIQKNFLENSKHKILLLFMSDVIYGFKTIFPIPLAQAGSFDFQLIEECAAISAKESYQNGLHVLFSPMLDLVRDPRWGRVMESPGEDVYLTSKFGKHVVKGYQGDVGEDDKIQEGRVAACIKHFAAYGSPEAGREYADVDMSELKFRQIYLPAYEAALKANAKLVMTAFNLLNGVPCTGNKWLNRKILREENNFNGVLVSDFSAIEELIYHGYAGDKREAARLAMEAGVDFDMMTSTYANEIEDLILSGDMDISLLDEAVWRILSLKNDLGLFENPYRGLEIEETGVYLTDYAKEKAVELIEKSVVLLKNKDKVLPLSNNKKISVIGPYGSSKFTIGFWGSVSGSPMDTIPLKDGLNDYFEKDNIKYSKGYNLFNEYEEFGALKDAVKKINGEIEDSKKLIADAVETSKDSDIIVLTFGEQFFESGEGASKTNLRISREQKELIKELHKLGKPIVGILYTGRPLVLTDVEEYFSSILLVWYPGTMGGVGISNILVGKANPSGKLAMTFPRSEGQIPIYYSQYSTGRPINESNHSSRFVSKYIDESNKPLYPFGYGLSYSDFNIELIGEEDRKVNLLDSVVLEYWVENTTKIDGEIVLQLYKNDKVASIVQPIKELKKSKRIYIFGGEKKKVSFKLNKEDFCFIDNKGNKILEEGKFNWYIGTSSEDISATVTIEFMKERI